MPVATAPPPPSYLAEPLVRYLQALLDELRNGELLVPRFQRAFVWKPEQQLELLRSIYSGIPIGSVMVWRTSQHYLETQPSVGPHKLPAPPMPTPGVPRTYLLDGLQRLTTLLVALVPKFGDEPPDKNEVSDESFDFHYDLQEQDFVLSRSGSIPPHYLPTTILLQGLELLRFQRKLERQPDGEILVARADRVANAFRNYKLPVIPIVSNDLEDATKAFQRINSGGTRMSDAHMVAALTYRPGFDLDRLLESAGDKLASVGWQTLDRKYVLATIRALKNLEIANPDAEQLSKALRADTSLLDRAIDCLIKAAAFFRSYCFIPSPGFVPYSYQAVVIAAAMDGHGELSQQQAQAIRRWLWRTTYTALFVGSRSQTLNSALRTVRAILTNRHPGRKDEEELVEILPTRFDFRGARSKAFAVRLAERHPKTLEGNAIDVNQCFAVFGSSALVQLLDVGRISATSVSGPENRILFPPDQWPVARLFLEVGGYSDNSAFLDSHAIPPDAAEAWMRGLIGDFLKLRRHHLIELERQFITELGLRYPKIDTD